MLTLSCLSRPSIALLALVSLLGVACGGADSEHSYSSGMDAELDSLGSELTAASGCNEGAVQSCKIYLGEHGDLNNCVYGLAVCSEGSWGECVDEDTLNDNPDLYQELLTSRLEN